MCERMCVTCLYMYLCSYEALLKLDRRCCTVHSFMVYVMNILYLLNYQLQYYLSWTDVHVCNLVSNPSVTLLKCLFLRSKNSTLCILFLKMCF